MQQFSYSLILSTKEYSLWQVSASHIVTKRSLIHSVYSLFLLYIYYANRMQIITALINIGCPRYKCAASQLYNLQNWSFKHPCLLGKKRMLLLNIHFKFIDFDNSLFLMVYAAQQCACIYNIADMRTVSIWSPIGIMTPGSIYKLFCLKSLCLTCLQMLALKSKEISHF